MKQIQSFIPAKYSSPDYRLVEEGIYQAPSDDGEELYVTSLSFVQEPELEEGTSAADISQYPLEDLLDRFYCHVSDFYEALNTADSQVCFLEFGADAPEDIRGLRGVIGKHVFNREEGDYIKLIIE